MVKFIILFNKRDENLSRFTRSFVDDIRATAFEYSSQFETEKYFLSFIAFWWEQKFSLWLTRWKLKNLELICFKSNDEILRFLFVLFQLLHLNFSSLKNLSWNSLLDRLLSVNAFGQRKISSSVSRYLKFKLERSSISRVYLDTCFTCNKKKVLQVKTKKNFPVKFTLSKVISGTEDERRNK